MHYRYQEAASLHPDREVIRILYSNCSLAYTKAHRYQDALEAADKAIAASPTWFKSHWRRGTALYGLRQLPSAVDAFLSSWNLATTPQDKELAHKKLKHTIQRLTREQLGDCILGIFKEMEVEGRLSPAGGVEAPPHPSILREAAFKLIADAHKNVHPKHEGPYYASLLRWKMAQGQKGVDVGEAYTVRAAVHVNAQCYLQARHDAQHAIQEFMNKMNRVVHGRLAPGTPSPDGQVSSTLPTSSETATANKNNNNDMYSFSTKEQIKSALSAAYFHLGEAYKAKNKDHSDHRPVAAFKAWTLASHYDPHSQMLRDRLNEITEELTNEQVDKAASEVFVQLGGWRGGDDLDPLSLPSVQHQQQHIFRVDVVVTFEAMQMLSSEARERVRRWVADVGEVALPHITLERVAKKVKEGCTNKMHVEVYVQVFVGHRLLQGNALVKKVSPSLQSPLEDCPIVACTAELVDITLRTASTTAGPSMLSLLEGDDASSSSLVVSTTAKTELEVPYKMYRLVTSTGREVERVDKHPFAMSRVYYDANEKTEEETWVEVADGSCRWRQTAGEVKIIALKVPKTLSPKDLKVDIGPYHLKVYRRRSGSGRASGGGNEERHEQEEEEEVFLQGRLHRGVIPEDSFWTHLQGDGEDGCCISLQKMNLEVLQQPWSHSESWWTKVFEDHTDIAWDDYEKDYSDLPEEVMHRHRIREAKNEAVKGIERGEREKREGLQEADDLRKRRRQERLNVLRSGSVRDWVLLNREG